MALLDVAAYDDTMLDELWKTNVGSGFSAPPMTFEVDSKQYGAIASGPRGAQSKLVLTPELKDSATRRCYGCSGCEAAAGGTGAAPQPRSRSL